MNESTVFKYKYKCIKKPPKLIQKAAILPGYRNPLQWERCPLPPQGRGSAPTQVQVPSGVAMGQVRTWLSSATESTPPVHGVRAEVISVAGRAASRGLRSRGQPPQPALSSHRGWWAGEWSVDVHCRSVSRSLVGKASVLRKARRGQ